MGKGRQIAVQCVYSEAGGTLPGLLAESFRLYLRRWLDTPGWDAAGPGP